MRNIPELTDSQMAKAIPARLRKRLIAGHVESGADIVALRRFVGLSQQGFARALVVSIRTVRNWERGRRRPIGPALLLVRIAARHPGVIREVAASTIAAE